jgi:uncharacterized membrane protein
MSDRWKIILAVSLAVNLFLIGAGVGVAVVGARMMGEHSDFRHGGYGGYGAGNDGGRITSAFQSLPPERRQALRDLMRAQALDAAPDLQVAREARQEATRLMTADPYDAAAVTAALAKGRDADARARARIDATLASRLASLTPQERQMFSRLLMRGPGRGGGGPRGPRGGQGGPVQGPPPESAPAGPPPK